MVEVKRKIRSRELPLKRRNGTSRRMVSQRLPDKPAGETDTRKMEMTDELEAEQAVTRICNSILGRLNVTEAERDQGSRRRPMRRPPN